MPRGEDLVPLSLFLICLFCTRVCICERGCQRSMSCLSQSLCIFLEFILWFCVWMPCVHCTCSNMIRAYWHAKWTKTDIERQTVHDSASLWIWGQTRTVVIRGWGKWGWRGTLFNWSGLFGVQTKFQHGWAGLMSINRCKMMLEIEKLRQEDSKLQISLSLPLKKKLT